jgi:hypothetical protein
MVPAVLSGVLRGFPHSLQVNPRTALPIDRDCTFNHFYIAVLAIYLGIFKEEARELGMLDDTLCVFSAEYYGQNNHGPVGIIVCAVCTSNSVANITVQNAV